MSRDVIVFDVNETLLDVRALAPRFVSEFGDAELLAPWFSQMLRNSLVATLTSTYEPFDRQGTDALVSVASRAGHPISTANAAQIVSGMSELPAHPDVQTGLSMLLDAGFELIALTNSSPDMVGAQIDNAGLTGVFASLLSVESARVFKPHPAAYGLAATHTGVALDALWMVAAHDWDVTGAKRAGMRGAFVARPGQTLSALGEPPDIVGKNLVEVATELCGLQDQSP